MSDNPAASAHRTGMDEVLRSAHRRSSRVCRDRPTAQVVVDPRRCLITVAAAAAFSYRQTPMYRSSESVQVKPLNPDQAFQGSYTYNFGVSMTTEQALALSPAVQDLAQQQAATQPE